MAGVDRGRLARLERLERRLSAKATDLRSLVAAMRSTVPARPGVELAETPEGLPISWYPLLYHAGQAKGFYSDARFRVFECGRRSGKTEGRKREIAIRSLDVEWFRENRLHDRYIVAGAPTHQQAMRLYWRSLLRLIPKDCVVEARKSEGEIETVTGALIRVTGMDVPERVEGEPIDDLFLDEFADMRADVWFEHLRGSLSTRGRPPGRATFFGTPDMAKGQHFIELCDAAQTPKMQRLGWEHHHWSSEGVIEQAEWEEAMASMPEDVFAVEYRGERRALGQRIYYPFDRYEHGVYGLKVFPHRPLIVACDFNFNPATAVFLQEQCIEDYDGDPIELPDEVIDGDFTAVVGEIWIERTHTPTVMRAVLAKIEEWGHQASVRLYGDASGGADGSAKVAGSDWELIRKTLGPVLGDRVSYHVPRKNPDVKPRINAVNLRLRSTDGWVRMLVDREAAPNVVKDFEQVVAKEGTASEPDKDKDPMRTHVSDSIGYYCAYEFPARSRRAEARSGRLL